MRRHDFGSAAEAAAFRLGLSQGHEHPGGYPYTFADDEATARAFLAGCEA